MYYPISRLYSVRKYFKRPDMDGRKSGLDFQSPTDPICLESCSTIAIKVCDTQQEQERKTVEERAREIISSPLLSRDRGRNGGRIGDSLSISARGRFLSAPRPPVGFHLVEQKRNYDWSSPRSRVERPTVRAFWPSSCFNVPSDPSAREPFQILQGLAWHPGLYGRFFPPGFSWVRWVSPTFLFFQNDLIRATRSISRRTCCRLGQHLFPATRTRRTSDPARDYALSAPSLKWHSPGAGAHMWAEGSFCSLGANR